MNHRASKAILFILNPFISAIFSLKDIRDGVSHRFLYLWFLIFGIGFCAISEVADSFRYVEKFMIEHNYTWSQYMMEINEYFTFESNIKDIYTLTVNFLSDDLQITTIGRILYMLRYLDSSISSH